MEKRQYMQIPGPTNVPNRLLKALATQPLDHRGEEFESLVEKCLIGLKEIFRTENEILIYPSSGSGMLEAAIVNLFSVGDTILIGSMGQFSERMGLIAEAFGLKVIRVSKKWGEAVKAEEIREILEQDENFLIKGICVPQNETATGVKTDIEAISSVIQELNHPGLFIVDGVSSIACMPFENDKWNVDIAICASQKGLMLPSGMGIISISDKAWEAIRKSTLPKWYWDFDMAREKLKEFRFTYTPVTTLLTGLSESIDMIREEGLENIWSRHALIGKGVRASANAMGLNLLAEKGFESDTITAILLPEEIDYEQLAELLKSKFEITIGGGLQKFEGKMLRVGHMGSISNLDVYTIMGALEMCLFEMGYKVELGTAAKAIAQVFLS